MVRSYILGHRILEKILLVPSRLQLQALVRCHVVDWSAWDV